MRLPTEAQKQPSYKLQGATTSSTFTMSYVLMVMSHVFMVMSHVLMVLISHVFMRLHMQMRFHSKLH